MLDGLEVRQQQGDQGDQRAVDDDHAVGGVVDDPRELLGRQAQVQGVEHGAHGGDRVVRLDVLGVVPHQGGDPLVAADAEVLAQGVRQLGSPGADLRVGTALRGSSPVQVITCEVPWIDDPWVRILEISSGTSCMVLSTASSWATLPGVGTVCADCAHIPRGMSLGERMIDHAPGHAGSGQVPLTLLNLSGQAPAQRPRGACRAPATPPTSPSRPRRRAPLPSGPR